MRSLFLGIDVGTGSARAGLFSASGELVAAARRDIRIWHEVGGIAEQSTTDIWSAVCQSVNEAVAEAGAAPEEIRGIGVDATCSLAVIAADGAPLAVGPSGDAMRNVIVWMDHRASEETRAINRTGHLVLNHVGGQVSPEMQTPKLLWLKTHAKATYDGAAHFFDLSDYLTWCLTGDPTRSTCTLTCKWTYLAHAGGWDSTFFEAIGLGDQPAEGYARIGARAVDPGTAIGDGLSPAVAKELGLAPGTPVAAALIDAHAGGVGTVGAAGAAPVESNLAYIFGTSACAMASTQAPTFVKGIWGPYFSSMVPGLWLNEAGQSAAGAAIDRLVAMHPESGAAARRAEAAGASLLGWLEQRAMDGRSNLGEVAFRSRDLQILPEFLGNRSPHADPEARAVLAGFGADAGEESLVDLYVAGLCSLGYGLKDIVDALEREGVAIANIVVSGGAARSPLVRQILADSTGKTIAVPRSDEPVLLGSAMLGAVAAGHHPDLVAAMGAMSAIETTHEAAGGDVAAFHRAKAECHAVLQDAEHRLRQIMQPVAAGT